MVEQMGRGRWGRGEQITQDLGEVAQAPQPSTPLSLQRQALKYNNEQKYSLFLNGLKMGSGKGDGASQEA